MIRTQIQLPEEQYRILKEIALEKSVSMAEIIRESIEIYIRSAPYSILEDKYQRALDIIAITSSGVTDLSTNHDDYLAEVYEEEEG